LSRFAQLSPIPVDLYKRPESGYKTAAVIALVFPKNEEWHLLFIERASKYPNDKHAGQISFPGGQQEADETHLECALRELEEEVGIGKEKIEVIGALSELYISVSNFLVYPFLAFANGPLEYTLEENEVKSILEIQFSHLLNPDILKYKDILVNQSRLLKNVPYYDLGEHTLWGATSMMTAEILSLCTKQY